MTKLELRKNWVKALRSGDYQQTKGWLNTEQGWCCLGVLCDISGLGGWEDSSTKSYEWGSSDGIEGIRRFVLADEHRQYVDEINEEHIAAPPQEVLDAVGMRESLGRYFGDSATRTDVEFSLSGLNDGSATFNEIADVIESEPRGLFDD